MLASEAELITGCESLKLEVVTYCRYSVPQARDGQGARPHTNNPQQ